MKPAFRAAIFLIVLFAIPIIPFLLLGETFEQSLLNSLREPSSPSVIICWVVGLLTADMFLPVPSSAVMTYAGGSLGLVSATFWSWIGLSLGATGGFGLSRLFGERIARRFSESDDIVRMSEFTRRHGPIALVLTRALPILAEACVLMLGAGQLSWQRFLPAMLLSNFALALTYSACGVWFRDSNVFPIAIAASGTAPLIAALIIRKLWVTKPDGSTSESHQLKNNQ